MTPNSLRTLTKSIKFLHVASRLFAATPLITTRLISRTPYFLWLKPKETILVPPPGVST